MRWLILSDLHVGRADEAQELALSTLVDSILRQSGGRQFDLVLLSGDLTYSGKKTEYDRLVDFLISPLRSNPDFADSRFIAVPGNHDVDCDIGYPPTVEALGPTRVAQFFHFDHVGKALRSQRSGALSAYAQFMHDAGVEGVDPTEAPATSIVVGSTPSVEIVCAVTCYFSSKDLETEFEKTPAPVHPIRQLLAKPSDCVHRFVLGHHPTNWFAAASAQQLENLLSEHNAVYIHGHEHRIQPRFGRKGLTSIGFGAAYQSSMTEIPKPYYRNSYAICELDDSLHLQLYAWDAENGQWVPETTLPADFDERSNLLDEGRVLPLPATKLKDRPSNIGGLSAKIAPLFPHLTDCYWLAENDRNRWFTLLEELDLVDANATPFRPSTTNLPEGHLEIRLQHRGKNTLVHAVAAHGDLFSYDQVVGLNTMVDTESLSGCLIVTLGQLADPALTLVNRLGDRKNIRAVDKQALTRLWLEKSSSPLVTWLKASDVASTKATLLVVNNGYNLLLTDQLRNEWFQVVDESGAPLTEADSQIYELRNKYPSLATLSYLESSPADASSDGNQPTRDDFNRMAYLEAAYSIFDDVRYAPLAAIGFRFRNTSLSGIYIQTGADTAGDSKSDQSLQRAVTEYVESMQLDRSLADQLEAQLRSRYGLGRSTEAGVARKLYQRYGNVVVLGDPGSGKTCFVKFEMLAYCRPPEDELSWYGRHLPIYIPLAEAAELLRDTTDLVAVCSRVAARHQLHLPEHAIIQSLSDGQAAFFFDGLDEVGRIKERVELLSKIEDLVSRYAKHGNRFVLTSRPAAIQPVDIPDAFTYLHLKGLTDDEIRLLSERVLTSRLGVSEDEALANEEVDLVNRLLSQVQETPGLRRISRNPLLLTLIVLIFANTGTLSARRHVVYTQAVKTLISFRHRETMDQVLPEADLRTRLGRLAYAMYSRQISDLPTQDEVIEAFDLNDGSKDVDTASVRHNEEFLRRVAEATGLLVVHTRETASHNTDAVVSFMHYSFLEYYAAVGFLDRDFEKEIPSVIEEPHWRDVVTLMVGLLSEHRDITYLLKTILNHESDLEHVTSDRLRLAFDCAFECDVPPAQAQRMLAERLAASLSNGALRYSAHLREALADSVDRLTSSCGLAAFEDLLLNGIENRDPTVAAAFIDFVSRLNEPLRFGTPTIERVEYAFANRKHTAVQAACAGALMRRPEFRTDEAIKCVGRCLAGNLMVKHAAMDALQSDRALGRKFLPELTTLLDDPNTLVSSSAAECILSAGVSRDGFRSRETARILERALDRWIPTRRPVLVGSRAVAVSKDTIHELIDSPEVSEVVVGTRLLPLSDFDTKSAHTVIMGLMASHKSEHRVVRACLDSLGAIEGALDLVTLAQTDLICTLAASSTFRDVRIGAVKALGMLSNDEQVVSTLVEYCGLIERKRSLDQEQIEEGFRALAMHARRDASVQTTMVNFVLLALPKPGAREFGDDSRQRQLRSMLLACESIGVVVDGRLTERLRALSQDFRTPKALREQALRTYGTTAKPTRESISYLTQALETSGATIGEACYGAIESFLAQCRRRVEYVRAVYGELPRLRGALIESWKREKSYLSDRIDSARMEKIRASLAALDSLLISYSEFADRMHVRA